MYFKRLEIQGFKSFAEPVVIDFHEGITCIVGPNGSGKSNISDAIRWVLGEQSPKALRGGKMEEVIFAGTANRKSRGMAEVTLIIDNSKGILDIDYNEVAITRRMYRSGESEYLINNNQCRLKDIRELIMDTGIGVDGYSIIGQGKIADIVSNKPESRREIFEEAAGVVMYKSKKAEAERKLESTSTNLDRVNDIITEIEGRIDTLKDDSEKAKEYLELRETYTELEINIILKNIENLSKTTETYKGDIEKLAADIDEINKGKYAADREYDSLRQRTEELDRTMSEKRDRILRLVEEINEITSRKQLNKERMAGIQNEYNHLQEDLVVLEKSKAKDEDAAAKLYGELAELEAALDESNRMLEGQIAEYNTAVSDKNRVSEALTKSNDRLFELYDRKNSLQGEIKSMESMRDALLKNRSETASLSDTAVKNRDDFTEELDKNRRLLEFERENLKNAQKEINEYQSKASVYRDELNDITEKIAKANTDFTEVSSRKKTMEEMESNYEGYNFGVKSLMKASLPGIIGVSAELMEVPEGYEVAIETAMGPAMQNIICSNDHDAQVGVRFLKSNKAGRLTFLPVTSVKGRPYEVDGKLQSERGFKGLGSEIVTFDETYRGIFEYLLGRVAIVDNMSTALKLSKMKTGLRFVTMEGEVVNNSGAITGGAYRNKTANLLERKAEINRLEEQVDQLEGQVKRHKEKKKQIVDLIEKNEEIISSARAAYREVELRIVTLDNQCQALEGRLEEERNISGRYDSELSSINEELERNDELTENLNRELVIVQDEIGRVEGDMAELKEKLAAAEKSAGILSDQITQVKISYNDRKAKEESAKAILKNHKALIQDADVQLEQKRTRISLLEYEKQQLENSSMYEGDVDEKYDEKQSLEAEVEKITGEKAAIHQKQNAIDDEQKRRDIELNSTIDQKNNIQVKLGKSETQLDSLKDRLWDDFEVSFIQALDMKKENFALNPAIKESRQIRGRMKDLGDVNIGAIKEYETVKERLSFLTLQRDDILQARDELNAIISDMDTTIKLRFKENFDKVVDNFQDIFKELFGGGYAELRLEDENNPLESGIDIIAQPPGKKLQNINLMSGGEKTMTAIALMFAVLRTKPTPFCILDEVEAALDDNNIDRFAQYLRKFDNIQFALVTHQKATMEHADVLYGVTMAEHGVSKILSLKLGDEFEI